MSSLNVNDTNFEKEVLNADGLVVVDFWAKWCQPCQAMSPLIDEVANELSDKLKVVKVDIEDSPEAPTKYNVRGVPTLMVFKEGQVVDTRVGGMNKDQLNDWLGTLS